MSSLYLRLFGENADKRLNKMGKGNGGAIDSGGSGTTAGPA